MGHSNISIFLVSMMLYYCYSSSSSSASVPKELERLDVWTLTTGSCLRRHLPSVLVPSKDYVYRQTRVGQDLVATGHGSKGFDQGDPWNSVRVIDGTVLVGKTE